MTAFLETFFSEKDNAFLEIILLLLLLPVLPAAPGQHKPISFMGDTVADPPRHSAQRIHHQIIHIKNADLRHKLQSFYRECK